jgi:hypothetical protein
MSQPFNLCRVRAREIARLVQYRHGGWPVTDDADTYLVCAAYHLPRHDLAWHVGNWLYSRFGVDAYADTLDAIAQDVIHSPRQRLRADDVAHMLRVTYAERIAIRATTIGAIDANKRARTLIRKQRARHRERARRRANGAIPRERSLSRTQPWIAEGISRRTWYRRRNRVGTNTWPPLLYSHGHATVPRTYRRTHMRSSGASLVQ